MSLMGKYMKPCGKIESFWKGKLGYLLWENVFLMWKPWIPCIVTGSPREKFWEHKWVLTNSFMGILLIAVFFSAAGEKLFENWTFYMYVFKCENTIFMLLNSKIFFPYGKTKGKLRIPYGKRFGSEFAYGKGFGQTPPPTPRGGVHSFDGFP